VENLRITLARSPYRDLTACSSGSGDSTKGETSRSSCSTPQQKAFNKKLSKARMVVKHTISRLKKFNFFGQEFGNRLRHYDAMTDIVSGLINFRMLGAQIDVFRNAWT
jgi:hypothetical protein